MVKRIVLVALAVVAGDWVAAMVLPKVGLSDDPNTVFDAYDIVSALLIGVVYVTMHRLFKL